MKSKYLFYAFIFLPSLISAQDSQEKKAACERETNAAANAIYQMMVEHNFDNFDEVLADWQFFCAENEVMLRMQILKNIYQAKSIKQLWERYSEGYLLNYNNRLTSAYSPNFREIFSYYPAYYNYLPLRDPLDSLSQKFAAELLDQQAAGSDEKLLCILFSKGFKAYGEALKAKEFEDAEIVIKHHRQKREKLQTIMWLVNAGVIQSLDSKNVIGLSYQLGVGGYGRLSDHWQMGVFVHYRLFDQRDDYNFTYKEDTLGVQSWNSASFGLAFRYKVYNNEELMLWPNLKVGAAQIYTDFDGDEGQKETVDALHIIAGIDLLFPAFKNDLWALGINYHYIPYSWNNRLISNIEESYFSIDLSYCF